MKKNIWIWHGCSDPSNLWLKVTGSQPFVFHSSEEQSPPSKRAVQPRHSPYSEVGGSEPPGVVGSGHPLDELKLPCLSRDEGWVLGEHQLTLSPLATSSFDHENCRTCQPSSRNWSVCSVLTSGEGFPGHWGLIWAETPNGTQCLRFETNTTHLLAKKKKKERKEKKKINSMEIWQMFE